MIIIWKPEYSVNVDAIDAQHKQLLEIVNLLNKPDEKVEFMAVLLKVGSYISQHLKFEEELMKKLKYPKIADHITQHDVLRKQYEIFMAGTKDEKTIGRTRLLIYKWFVNHVINDKMDKELGQFLQRIGVFPAVHKLV